MAIATGRQLFSNAFSRSGHVAILYNSSIPGMVRSSEKTINFYAAIFIKMIYGGRSDDGVSTRITFFGR